MSCDKYTVYNTYLHVRTIHVGGGDEKHASKRGGDGNMPARGVGMETLPVKGCGIGKSWVQLEGVF
jgi:hypothetical protein